VSISHALAGHGNQKIYKGESTVTRQHIGHFLVLGLFSPDIREINVHYL
jgi:hypothetical protein